MISYPLIANKADNRMLRPQDNFMSDEYIRDHYDLYLTTEYITDEHGADQIVLGCTHYPFLLDAMRKAADGYEVTFVDASEAVARRVVQLLDANELRAEQGHIPQYVFETFADEAYRQRLERKAFAE